VLIRLARKAAGLSIAAAVDAAIADIGISRWSQIENGYEIKRGRAQPVRGRDDTVAHMAYAVGIAPHRLDQVGRSDAGDVLREILRQRAEAADLPPGINLDGLTPEQMRLVDDFVAMLRSRSPDPQDGRERREANGA
jgi:hypothetical protein